jgi:hypothetical protein
MAGYSVTEIGCHVAYSIKMETSKRSLTSHITSHITQARHKTNFIMRAIFDIALLQSVVYSSFNASKGTMMMMTRPISVNRISRKDNVTISW